MNVLAEPYAALLKNGLDMKPARWCDLLRALQQARASGELVASACPETSIRVVDGRITSARFRDRGGLPALVQCIVRGRCRWQLQAAPEAEPALAYRIDRDTDTIISGLQRVLDNYGLLGEGQEAAPPPAVDDPQATHIITDFHPPGPGDELGRCRLEQEIGRGSTSIVYRAQHLGLDIAVAVKVLLPDPGDSRSEIMSVQEARLLARLHHPCILRVLDFARHGRWPYLVIEFIDGPSLAEVIKQRGRLREGEVIDLLRQIAAGLAYAYDSEGIIHCDLKPGNILLGADGRATIADLGLARVCRRGRLRPGDLSGRHRTDVAGTPAYISPEQVASGGRRVDHRSDMYSLGAIAYHALAGRPPYEHPEPVQQMLLHTRGGFTPLAAVNDRVSAATDRLLSRLLAREPERRFDSYADLLDTLQRIYPVPGGFTPAQRHLPRLRRLWRRLRRGRDRG